MDDFVEEANIDMDNKRILLDCSMYIDRETADAGSMQNSQKLTALFSSKTLDVVVSDEANFQFCAAQGCYYDLKEILPEEIYQKYSDYFVEYTVSNTNKTAVYGINLKDSQILQKEGAFDKNTEPIFSICVTSKQIDNSIAFLEYLMGEGN